MAKVKLDDNEMVDTLTGELELGEPPMVSAVLDENGHEILDPVPVAPPLGYVAQPSLIEQIQAAVRAESRRIADLHGVESFEEADDFDVGDDFDPTSPYEVVFDPVAGHVKKNVVAGAESPVEGSSGPEGSQGSAKPTREALDGLEGREAGLVPPVKPGA